jgi:hypothetical protein
MHLAWRELRPESFSDPFHRSIFLYGSMLPVVTMLWGIQPCVAKY